MENKKNIFTLMLVFSPVLAMYSFWGIEKISMLDVSLLLFILVNIKEIFYSLKGIDLRQPGMLFVIYILLQFVLFTFFKFDREEIFAITLRTGKYVFYLLSVYVLARLYFDFDKAINYLKYLTIFAAVYFFLQTYLLRVHGVYLKGYLPFWTQTRQELVEFSENAWNAPHVRVRSIFGEISQFSIIAGAYMFTTIQDIKSMITDKKTLMTNFFIILALLLTISNVAYFVLVFYFIAVSYLSIDWSNKDKVKKTFVYLLIATTGFMLIFMSTGVFQKIIDRFAYSFSNRFSPYIDFINSGSFNSIFNYIFGLGMDTSILEGWFPSTLRIFYFFGLVGIIL